ncbi:LolA family protein [Tellurirhabdus bombi]|uniref:LolA family protein n=1 Tax=Tellurirhabdus bombi TaxID=2907205 RepID=UPI001F218FD0|nr:hypothetical protein [Tellurirhabdus bombi]
MKSLVRALPSLITFICLSSFLSPLQTIDRLSAQMTTRQVQQGKSVTIKGELFYQRNGNMITHFSYPKEVIILANKLGETRIYDPKANAVMRFQNAMFGTQTTQLAYFLTGSTADMGLNNIGFVQEKVSNNKGLLVTDWKPKVADKKTLIQRVRVVYNGTNPIYMHYTDANQKIIRKVYYSGYQTVGERPFPTSTTEIMYEKGDSTVSKTTYSNFQVNQQANSSYFNYTIPASAKIQQP